MIYPDDFFTNLVPASREGSTDRTGPSDCAKSTDFESVSLACSVP
jgi:hypothetical protein